MKADFQTLIIENIHPELDGGRYPVKRERGDVLEVSADIFKDGHDLLTPELLIRKKGAAKWDVVRMQPLVNDRWKAEVVLSEIGRYEYTLTAYPDFFRTWQDEVRKKHEAGQDVASELLEGKRIMGASLNLAPASARAPFQAYLDRLEKASSQAEAVWIALNPEANEFMDAYPDRSRETRYDKVLEVVVERTEARFAAWYEFFPVQGKVQGRSSTFKECEKRLPDIKGMGFNVVYLPPIHPIGKTNRKGPNNSLKAGPNDPGSPYAIGGEAGGHKAVEPGLGTLKDFDHFVEACKKAGLDVALDFAINCSPDHPYVTEHPGWFYKRPDDTIKYAENPPKKYQDIYPLNMYCDDWKNLWEEMRSIIEFWIGHGVNVFRVDNPHTKPVAFWEWLIRSVQEKHPRVIFLSESFTRPKMMRAMAKAGFTQSYTYFTWRNFKAEIVDYFTELTRGPMREYFRGNLFTNTPDILPTILQEGGRPAFKMRATLAATLSSVYGIYSGFELCENRAIPGTEEYLNSEKYEYKVWDWNRTGNIKEYLARLNRIRKENPALQEYDNLEFYHSENDRVVFYGKSTPDKQNNILVVVSLDPFELQHSFVYVPLEKYGIRPDETYQVHDLITDKRFLWKGQRNYVELGPEKEIAHIFRVRRWVKRENQFDYYDM